jgi:hypothetical protein
MEFMRQLLVGLMTTVLLTGPALAASPLFVDDFSGGINSGSWHVTSGQWTATGGRAFSNSGVFRADTRRTDFGNVDVTFSLVNNGLTTGSGESWHGVHMFLRRQSEFHTYYLSINRRDGRSIIKKKVPGGSSNGGTYYDLASASFPVPYGSTQRVMGRAVNNSDGSVTVSLWVNGRLLMSATDRGTGGPPIRNAGGTGVRGDFTAFYTDDFTVTPAGAVADAPAPAPGNPGNPGLPGPTPHLPAPPAADPELAKAPQRFLSPALGDGVNDAALFGPQANSAEIFDVSGRKVRTVSRSAGVMRWDGRNDQGEIVESGVYIARVRMSDGETTSQSFAIVR